MSRYIMFSIICFLPFETIRAEGTGARDLLEKFRATQSQTTSFIAKAQNKLEYLDTINNYEGVKYTSTEFRTDGNRVCRRRSSWGDVTSYARGIGKDEPRYGSFLWDGEMFIQYRPSVTSMKYTRAYIRKDDTQKKTMVAAGYRGAPFLGIFEGDYDPIDFVFLGHDTTSLSVRDQMESVNGYGCYVIDADTKRGKYSVWLDPTHGYNISKAEVVRRKGDLVYGHKEPMPHGEIRFSLPKVSFKKIDEVWIPMEATYEISWLSDEEGKMVTKVHNTRTEVVLNPDHEALGSFKPDDIKNGTHVFLVGAPGARYSWQDGKLIPDVDKATIDQLDKMTDEIIRKDRANDANNSMKALQCMLSSVNVTVAELLAKYKLSQQQMQSFTAKAETAIADTGSVSKTSTIKEKCDFACDGKRVSHRSYVYTGKADERKQQQDTSFVWDGKHLIQYRKGQAGQGGQVYIAMNDARKNEIISTQYKGAALLGFCSGDYERIDSILGRTKSISVRKGTVKQGQSICYIIDAITERGNYSVWLDAAHGYNIAEIQVLRKPGDVIRNAGHAKTDMRFSLSNVRFENIKGTWFPAEADIEMSEDNNSRSTKWHHKRTEILLNPDHEKLGSFSADDIPDGTSVIVSGHYGDKVKWQNGKVLTEDGKNVDF